MPRYADVDKLLDYLDAKAFDALQLCDGGSARNAYLEAMDAVVHSKIVDAVDVIRCVDCKHRGIVTECPMCYTEDSYDEDDGYDYWDVDKTVDDGFCHCGEMDAEVEG